MEWISAPEAARLSGRNKRNVYQWARKGYVRSKVEVTSPRQTRGLMVFAKDDVVEVANYIGQGARLDLFEYKDYGGRPKPKKRELNCEEIVFTDEQLEIARRVFGS